MPQSYETRLLRASVCGGDVVQFELKRPKGYEFAAGQWFRLTLQTAEGERSRIFSHASTPLEPRLLMATRLSGSAFKQALAKLAEGDAVLLQGPGGRLALPKDSSRVVFLTGGVGVTPVRSLLLSAVEVGGAFDDAVVFFGSRTEDCAPYAADLEALSGSGVRVVRVVEAPTQGWAGERGYIDADMVRRHVDGLSARPFIVTGPPAMVAAMEVVLDDLGIDAAQRILERFTAPGPAMVTANTTAPGDSGE